MRHIFIKHRTMKHLLFALALLSTAVCASAQNHQIAASLDSMMQQYQQEKNFSGVVMVSQKGKPIYSKAFGLADREKNVLNQPATNFNIASLGKTFTAVMIMQLVQEGKLKLTDTLSKLLPEYHIKNADQITVRHLLTHTSGINNYMTHPQFESKMKSLKSLDAVMPLVADMEPTMARPGERFDYSNSGFITLGKIIEKITGKNYMTNMQERIFEKAGISNSYINYPATFNAPKEATPYYVFSKNSFKNASSEEFPAFSDGGMQSNVIDLTKFANALLQEKLLKINSRDELWKGAVPMGRGGIYAYGWIQNENPYGKHIVSHDGGGKAFSSDLKIVVEDEYVIAVLINTRLNPREVSNNIVKLLYTGTFNKPVKSLEHAVFEQVEKNGWTAAREQLPVLMKERNLEKIPSVWTYISLMEMLADAGRPATAFEVLDMAVKDFPNNPEPFNVAAQISLATGKKDDAKKYYEKALEVNPNDGFAKNGLKSLAN
jgi:CubicO group peptidase (beta-lactamase class C family)